MKNEDVLNKYYYRTGVDNYKNIVLANQIDSKEEFQNLFDTYSRYIYTDLIDKPSVFNRQKVIDLNTFKVNFDEYKKDRIFKYNGLYGNSTIYKIMKVDFSME